MLSVAIVINARLGSSRLPNKIIKPFGDTTLLDIALKKLAAIDNREKYLAVHDQELIDIYRKYENDIGLIVRSPESVEKGAVPHHIAFQHYMDVNADSVMVMNPCHPFTRPETYENAIQHYIAKGMRSMTSVVKKENIFFDQNGGVVNSSKQREVTTVGHDALFEMAHAFHIFPKNAFQEGSKIWSYEYGDPEMYIVDKMSALDVDDEIDFALCEGLYKSNARD